MPAMERNYNVPYMFSIAGSCCVHRFADGAIAFQRMWIDYDACTTWLILSQRRRGGFKVGWSVRQIIYRSARSHGRRPCGPLAFER